MDSNSSKGMNKMRLASIDIGTNTVLMLIAEYNGNDKVTVLKEEYDIARLGQNVDKTNLLSSESVQNVIQILKNFKNIALKFGVEKFIIAGTSALRDAKNRSTVISKIQDAINEEIAVISGNKEAKLSFEGSVENDKKNIVIDTGGGSTEVIYGKEQDIFFLKSFNIGAVRITERFFSTQPPSLNELEKAEKFINQEIGNDLEFNDFEKIYAVAGTATTIATTAQNLKDFDIDMIDGYQLEYMKLLNVFSKYASSDTYVITHEYGVHPKRSDLITAGALILKIISEKLGKNSIIVSAKGLRYGLIKDFINKFNVKFIRSN